MGVFKNTNGSKYSVVVEGTFKSIVLLRNLQTGEYVVALGFDMKSDSWDCGYYFCR